ncbi:hypothetical protein GCM10009823_27600 [Brevibacterium salitolerans]|uniref:Uncharacterized protein n=1 Tax=Brevibacterium salitolerans TaxID=1403566 RepID=A0ABN2X4E0_9MICO
MDAPLALQPRQGDEEDDDEADRHTDGEADHHEEEAGPRHRQTALSLRAVILCGLLGCGLSHGVHVRVSCGGLAGEPLLRLLQVYIDPHQWTFQSALR